jgi:hypothetical protein
MVLPSFSFTRSPSGPRVAVFEQIVSTDFELAYAQASVRKDFRKFGHNASIPANNTEDVWHGSSALYPGWLTAAAPLRIKAGGNANDAANGSGARSIVLQPHRSDFTWVDDESIVLATNGASASLPTAESFIRCTRAYVLRSGTYASGSNSGTNAGLVTIETAGGIEVAAIDTGDGQAEMSMFTVPAGYSLWIDSVRIDTDSSRPALVEFFQRQDADVVTAPFTARRSVITVAGVLGEANLDFQFRVRFPEKTDLWWRATAGSGGATAASVQYSGLLLSNA